MILTNDFWDELAHQLLQVASSSFTGHQLHHLLADLPDLTALCIARSLDLLLSSPGEPDAEHPKHIAVCGLNIYIRLDQSLPLSHQRSQLVGSEVHTLQIGDNS